MRDDRLSQTAFLRATVVRFLAIAPRAKYERHRLLTHLTIDGLKSFGSPGTRVCFANRTFQSSLETVRSC